MRDTGSMPAIEATPLDRKKDANYVFYELTRSICPDCRRVVDAHILIRDNKVFMRKRCPEHGQFEALVYETRNSTPVPRNTTSPAQFHCSSIPITSTAALMIAASVRTTSSTHAWASLK